MEGLVFQVSLLSTGLFFLNGYGASSPKVLLYGLGLLRAFMVPKVLLIILISLLDAHLGLISSESSKASLLKVLTFSLLLKKVGNGEDTSFWDDSWLTDSSLKLMYPRLFLLELDKQVTVASKLRDTSLVSSFRRVPRGGIEEEQLRLLDNSLSHIILPQISDRWTWNLESSGEFSAKSARVFIDDSLLPKANAATRWIKVVPIKINVFAWRVSLDKLPTRLNLSLRGVDIPSILCPLCSITVESSSHLLFSCHLARQLMIKVARWWDLDFLALNSYEEWLVWFNTIRLSKRLKEILEDTCYVMWWVI
ncbi:RNA-directed DNA polymerase, eukaryota [Tanacetum coccineum]